MKISKLITLLFLIVACASFAQTVTIPADNSSSSNGTNSLKRKPLGSYYGYERSAFIYSRYELGITGTTSITSIAFYCDSTNSFIAANTPVKVYARAIEDSIFAFPTTLANEMANTTLVYSGLLASTSFTENNWTTINFANNFTLVDTMHLELIIETNAGGTGSEGLLSKGFRYKTAGQKRFQYWQQDNSAPTGTGTIDTLRPNISINYTIVTTCSGAPDAGVIISTDTAVCKNTTSDFYLQGATNANQLSYLWQTSTDNSAWTNVVGNNVPNLSLNIDTMYYVRAIVSCLLQSDTAFISINSLLPIYCYCNASLGGNCSGYSIDSLRIETTTFNPTISGCGNNVAPHYSSYPATGANTATLTVAQTYSITIRQTGNNVTSMWIDEDHDGNFEQNEWIALTTSSVTNGLQTKTFSLPATAYNGLTGMRIRSRANGFANDSTKACTTFTSGETEDFLITILGGETIGLEQIKNNFSNAIIYPNPSNGTFHFQSYELNGEVEFTMIDILGKTVFTTTKQHNNLSELNTNLVSGTYFLIAKDKSGKMVSKKLIVE
jgi:hypothetical protein